MKGGHCVEAVITSRISKRVQNYLHFSVKSLKLELIEFAGLWLMCLVNNSPEV